MEYPDSVLAFKLLDNTGLLVKESFLTAASDRKFSSMKSALKRIFRNSSTATRVNEIKIEEEKEELFLVKSSKHQKNHSRYQQTGSKHKIAEQRETNPFDRNGRRKKCAICGSVFHWAEDCSHKRQKQEENEEKCNLALFTKEHKPENEILLTDSFWMCNH